MAHYDMLAIGSGPAGQKAAIQAAKLYKRVGLIERQEVGGGGAVNTGTIPSKSLRESVLYLSGFRQRSLYGASYLVKHDVTMEDLTFRCNHIVKAECDKVAALAGINRLPRPWPEKTANLNPKGTG